VGVSGGVAVTYLSDVEDEVCHCEREGQLLWGLVASPLYQLQDLTSDEAEQDAKKEPPCSV